jgi:hypothetical protein
MSWLPREDGKWTASSSMRFPTWSLVRFPTGKSTSSTNAWVDRAYLLGDELQIEIADTSSPYSLGRNPIAKPRLYASARFLQPVERPLAAAQR